VITPQYLSIPINGTIVNSLDNNSKGGVNLIDQ